MTKLDALKNELKIWGVYCIRSESNLAGRVRSPSATIEEIGRVGVFARGTGYLDQRSESQKLPDWIEAIDAKVNGLSPKMRTIIRAEYAMIGAPLAKAQKVGLSVPAFRRLLSIALVDLLSD